MFLELTKEEAMAVNTISALFSTQGNPQQLLEIELEYVKHGMHFAVHYLSFLKKFSHHLHEMGWCPDDTCDHKPL